MSEKARVHFRHNGLFSSCDYGALHEMNRSHDERAAKDPNITYCGHKGEAVFASPAEALDKGFVRDDFCMHCWHWTGKQSMDDLLDRHRRKRAQ